MGNKAQSRYITQSGHLGKDDGLFSVFCSWNGHCLLWSIPVDRQVIVLDTEQFVADCPAHILTHMASGTVVFLEQIISGQFFSRQGCIIPFRYLSKREFGARFFKFLNGICNVCLIELSGYTSNAFWKLHPHSFLPKSHQTTCRHFYRIQGGPAALIRPTLQRPVPELHEIIICVIYRGAFTHQTDLLLLQRTVFFYSPVFNPWQEEQDTVLSGRQTYVVKQQIS